jgi:FkbM family methyltransferase
MPDYTRAHPSPRYLALQAMYLQLHREGERSLGLDAESTFDGSSLLPHVARIKRLVSATGARTILDYGAGKGQQYRPRPVSIDGQLVAESVAEFWDVDEVRCYDPGYPPHATLPDEQFDGVISTDVLEHCPEEDLPWILDEMLAHARRFVFLNVACFPARKRLPNGENAHVTLHPPEWWRDLVRRRAERFPGLPWELHAVSQAGQGLREAVFRSDASAAPASAVPFVSVMIEGKPARFFAPNDMTRWRAESLYTKEPATIEWLRSMPLGSVFLDVGANVGMYTVFAAVAREASVFAVEPESQNYAALNLNIQLNGLDRRVLAFCAGFSDRAGLEPLYLAATHAGASCHSLGEEVGFDLKPRPAAFRQGAVAVRCDDLVAAGQLPVPAYVKIDVDGFEHKVIRGMARTLKDGRVSSLLVELNPHLPEHLESRADLEALGFRWDPAQVRASTRTSGPFEGVAEHVFRR